MVLYKNFKKSECYKNTKYSKYFKERLEFKNLVNYGSNKKVPVHNWFRYKEAFSRKLVETILSKFDMLSGNTFVFDPFCGIGTTPLTSKQLGLNFFASDLSPLCRFISQAKIDFDRYDLDEINKEIKKIERWDVEKIKKKSDDVINNFLGYPIFKKAFPNRNKLKVLFGLKKQIENKYAKTPLLRQFFNLALLNIVEDSSNTQKDGAFLRIIPKKNGKKVMHLFIESIKKLSNSLKEYNFTLTSYSNDKIKLGHGKIEIADSRNLPLPNDSVNITITSPPYLNRYDYTRIYQLELYLLFCRSFDDLKKIRYNTIRSHVEARHEKFGIFKSDLLTKKLSDLSERKLNNSKIPQMIQGYFDDMLITMHELYRITKNEGIIAFVVGNTRFSGVSIPVDTLLLEVGENVGFKPVEVWISRYKGNTPQQIKKYGLEAVRESVVLMKK